ncbi:MAG: hypothetical protein ORN25_05040 [Caulobacteraceae bacterium]|nr:hypothetical protein [Caulobacteraceae bacterium]
MAQELGTTRMHFLLNDVMFNLSDGNFSLPPADTNASRLRINDVTHLGAELFSANPELAHQDPARSLRLIGLILSKVSNVNAALFSVPKKGCPPQQVAYRFAELSFPIMADLVNQQVHGTLTAAYVNSQVWARLSG